MQLQTNSVISTSLRVHTLEPKISLLEKFDGITRRVFRGFVKKIGLVIQLHPHRYLDDRSRVGLVGTLLTGTVFTWFLLLIVTMSPFLQDLKPFREEFEAIFQDKSDVSCGNSAA
jgi:hypothetical protein